MTDMSQVARLFGSLLEERLATEIFTTEDSIRYTHFHAVLSTGFCRHTDIILEHPHPTLHGEIDTLISGRDGSPSIAIEFKYDREIPSKQSLNKTNRAGAMFSDLFRLAHVPDKLAQLKYFFYVTDSQMAGYFRNEKNGYRSFWELPFAVAFHVGSEWIDARPKSFRDKLSCSPLPCTVLGLSSRSLPREHYLRAYELKLLKTTLQCTGE